MRTKNIINRAELLKDQQRILGSLEARVRGIVAGILGGVQTNLAAELHGISLRFDEDSSIPHLTISTTHTASRPSETGQRGQR